MLLGFVSIGLFDFLQLLCMQVIFLSAFFFFLVLIWNMRIWHLTALGFTSFASCSTHGMLQCRWTVPHSVLIKKIKTHINAFYVLIRHWVWFGYPTLVAEVDGSYLGFQVSTLSIYDAHYLQGTNWRMLIHFFWKTFSVVTVVCLKSLVVQDKMHVTNLIHAENTFFLV